MKKVIKTALSKIINFWPIRVLYRLSIGLTYFTTRLSSVISWSFKRTENSNFYYDLTDKNKLELVNAVSIATESSPDVVHGYLEEILQDLRLRQHIRETFICDKSMKHSSLQLGRRIGWYAFVRALKPRLVVETGVHQGVGALVLISALMRNVDEGYDGRYLGTDIDPNAGELIKGKYGNLGRVRYGDSIESLKSLEGPIDLFVNDSDHSAHYEAREYRTIEKIIAPNAIILGDNSHVTSSLLDFSKEHGRSFLLFREEPKNHWYPGAGIGISFPSETHPPA